MKEKSSETILHEIEPVWNEESRVLILGTMPSPASRAAGFFYMHPQNRFWKVVPEVLGEKLKLPNNAEDREGAIAERRDFLLRIRFRILFRDLGRQLEMLEILSVRPIASPFEALFNKKPVAQITFFNLVVKVLCPVLRSCSFTRPPRLL